LKVCKITGGHFKVYYAKIQRNAHRCDTSIRNFDKDREGPRQEAHHQHTLIYFQEKFPF
jgi:hypothetical protein